MAKKPPPPPLDVHGNIIAEGSTITIPFVVVGLVPHEDRYLLKLQAIGGTGGKSHMSPRLDAIEPGLVELVRSAPGAGA